MPKKPNPAKLNRSQAIRDYLAQNPKATPREIQAALKAKGVAVSFGLAKIIRYKRGPGRPMGRPGRPKKAAAIEKKAPAEPKAAPNKSDAVRAYLKQNPTASPKAIQAALKAQGISISEGLASAVKYAKPKKGPGLPKGRRPGRPTGRRPGRPPVAATGDGMLRIDDLLDAKAFVDRVGGIEAARKAIEILAQLA